MEQSEKNEWSFPMCPFSCVGEVGVPLLCGPSWSLRRGFRTVPVFGPLSRTLAGRRARRASREVRGVGGLEEGGFTSIWVWLKIQGLGVTQVVVFVSLYQVAVLGTYGFRFFEPLPFAWRDRECG